MTAARVSIALSAAFLAILFLLHFLEPELDPSWRMISEYEIGRFGWMMRLAFFCWGGSVLALVIALWPSLRTLGGIIGRRWLLLIVVALFGAGIFVTQPITEDATTTAHVLHTLAGAIVILTFPIAASLVGRSLSRNEEWSGPKRQILWMTLLVWFAVIAYFSSIIISNLITPGAGNGSPEVYQGWPNRFMVVVYVFWLITVAVGAVHVAKRRAVAAA
jgi:hypothetical protein